MAFNWDSMFGPEADDQFSSGFVPPVEKEEEEQSPFSLRREMESLGLSIPESEVKSFEDLDPEQQRTFMHYVDTGEILGDSDYANRLRASAPKVRLEEERGYSGADYGLIESGKRAIQGFFSGKDSVQSSDQTDVLERGVREYKNIAATVRAAELYQEDEKFREEVDSLHGELRTKVIDRATEGSMFNSRLGDVRTEEQTEIPKRTLKVGASAVDVNLADLTTIRRLAAGGDPRQHMQDWINELQAEADEKEAQYLRSITEAPPMTTEMSGLLQDGVTLDTAGGILTSGTNMLDIAAGSAYMSGMIMAGSTAAGIGTTLLSAPIVGPGAPVVGRVAAGGTAFAMTQNMEYKMRFIEELHEHNLNPFNVVEVIDFAHNNPDEWAAILDSAMKQSTTIATAESLTMGFGGISQRGVRAAQNQARIGQYTERFIRGGAEAAGSSVIAAGGEAIAGLQSTSGEMDDVNIFLEALSLIHI